MKERWQILANLCKKINAKRVAEIGVSKGINASNWMELCPELETMFLVDINWSVFDTGLFSPEMITKTSLRLYQPYGFQTIHGIEGSLDLVFIDASHYYEDVLKDIETYMPMVRKGGIICGHDFTLKEHIDTEVRQAVLKKFEMFSIEQDTLDNGQIYVWWVQL